MRFESFYSSSRGNLYRVTARNGRSLLVECGVPWRKLQKAVGYDLSNVVGCLCSHEHNDHSAAAENVIEAGITLYCSRGTAEALNMTGHRKVRIIHARDRFRVADTFDVFPFATHHDAVEPLGLIINDRDTGEVMLFATDTSHISQRFAMAFNIIAIECSYDKETVQRLVDSGGIAEVVATRLLTSHMERHVTMKYLKNCCDLSRCRELWLLHISDTCIDKAATRKWFAKELFVSVLG